MSREDYKYSIVWAVLHYLSGLHMLLMAQIMTSNISADWTSFYCGKKELESSVPSHTSENWNEKTKKAANWPPFPLINQKLLIQQLSMQFLAQYRLKAPFPLQDV
ncbi:MAG: hypothetical protein ACJATE_001306 [Bacteroidia bacterium]|jgi:hypothetical protein